MNQMILTILVVVCCLATESSAAGSKWAYEGQGSPADWAHMFITCGGSRQSPINIESGNVKKESWKPFVFKHYGATPTRMRVKNNGHTAQVEMDAPKAPRVSNGGLKDEYVFAQFHYHWGKDNSQGSEHTVDGVRYPMEMHFVHYKAAHGSLSEAVKHRDGLAVLGILFEISETDNQAFSPIVNALGNIRESGQVSDVAANFPLDAFLPTDRESFYRYSGSLTTPTCNEVVVWTVFRKTVPISNRQMMAFRAMMDGHGKSLVDNFRPPQQLHRRQVYVSATADSAGESTSMKKLGLALYFMSSMAVVMMNM